MGCEHDHRRPLTDCTMRSHIVVVLTPKFDLCPGVVKVQEPMLVQAFKTNAGVEAFNEGIVSGFSRSAEVQDDPIRIGPQVELARGELAAVVHSDASRLAERGNGLIEHQHYIGCFGLMPNPKRRAHPGEVIDQGQDPKPPSIEELIVHPIHGPTVIGCNSPCAIVSKLGHDPTTGRFVTHLQPFEPIEPVHAGSTHRPTLALQQDMDPPITVPDPRLRDLTNPFA